MQHLDAAPLCVTVHPHLRGEHRFAPERFARTPGSSPPAWGASGGLFLSASSRRFIPTCVGSIHRPAIRSPDIAVHPHLRGEHGNRIAAGGLFTGSSPPAWGALVKVRNPQIMPRFIPTCVGSISHCGPHRVPLPVHPHLRGEHMDRRRSMSGPVGSSPPAWGA